MVLMVVLVIAIAAVAVTIILSHRKTAPPNVPPTTASSSSSSAPSSAVHTITGTLTVIFPTAFAQGSDGDPCYVPTDYGNETDGDQVVITDSSGSTLGIGSLTVGILSSGPSGVSGSPVGCQFSFTAANVPDSPFYGVSFDGRMGPQYSESELQADNWTMSLTLTP